MCAGAGARPNEGIFSCDLPYSCSIHRRPSTILPAAAESTARLSCFVKGPAPSLQARRNAVHLVKPTRSHHSCFFYCALATLASRLTVFNVFSTWAAISGWEVMSAARTYANILYATSGV